MGQAQAGAEKSRGCRKAERASTNHCRSLAMEARHMVAARWGWEVGGGTRGGVCAPKLTLHVFYGVLKAKNRSAGTQRFSINSAVNEDCLGWSLSVNTTETEVKERLGVAWFTETLSFFYHLEKVTPYSSSHVLS